MEYKLAIFKIGNDLYELKSFIVSSGIDFTEIQSKDLENVKNKAKFISAGWIDKNIKFTYYGI